MEEVTAAAVQIVTAGPDWPAIAAGISAGLVGLAGIGGTFWQGKRAREAASADLQASLNATAANLKASIEAERDRAGLAEKRRVYAQCFIRLDAARESKTREVIYRGDASTNWRPSEDDIRAHDEAMIAALNAVSELELIAPPDVAEQAVYALSILPGGSPVEANIWNRARHDLRSAMVADLGEPVGPFEPSP